MRPTIFSHLSPLGAVAAAPPVVDSVVRLRLDPVPRLTAVDGTWWPYSRDAAAELPSLIAAVDRRLGRTTLCVGLHLDAWEHIPRRIQARGRQVRVDWFRGTDRRLITLTLMGTERVTLLVVPPGTLGGPAVAALTLAAGGTAGLRPIDILTAVRRPDVRGIGAPGDGDPAGRENEGHVEGCNGCDDYSVTRRYTA